MSYTEDYYGLKALYQSTEDDHPGSVKEEDYYGSVVLRKWDFLSGSRDILPGKDQYYCSLHRTTLMDDYHFHTEVGTLSDHMHIRDIAVEENQRFPVHIVLPRDAGKVRKVVFLLHGFNEKDWYKYLPWAKALSEGTGSGVILFPIAFHMQRAPAAWSSPREMFRASEERKRRYPNIVHSTLSNVAISMRLHAKPQRFIWSGLQTYYDVIQLIGDIRKGAIATIENDAQLHLFAYSIGGFLSQILKLTNPQEYFSASKVLLFCSGSTFNRFSPVSRFILDSEANVALYSFLVEHLDTILRKDHLLNHYINGGHPEGKVFHSMLDYRKMREYREGLLRKFESQIYALTLKKDQVIPSFEVMNTLKGAYRDIRIRVDEMDFERPYIHENPFPFRMQDSGQVDADFERVFDRFCRTLDLP